MDMDQEIKEYSTEELFGKPQEYTTEELWPKIYSTEELWPKQSKRKNLLEAMSGAFDNLVGALEVPTTMLSGMGAWGAGLIGTAGKTLYEFWKRGFRDVETPDPSVWMDQLAKEYGQQLPEMMEKIGALGTYQPKSQSGREIIEKAIYPAVQGLDSIAAAGSEILTDDPDKQRTYKEILMIGMFYGIGKLFQGVKTSVATKKPLIMNEVINRILSSDKAPQSIKGHITELVYPSKEKVTKPFIVETEKLPKWMEYKPKKVKKTTIAEDLGLPGERLNSTLENLKPEVLKERASEHPRLGLSIKEVLEKPKEQKFTFANSEMETAYQKNQGVKKPPLLIRAKEIIKELKNKSTRTYEYLPVGERFSEAKMALKILEKQPGVSQDIAIRSIHSSIMKLTPNELNLFARKVLLDDLLEDIHNKVKLPNGFTEEGIINELSRLDLELSKYSEISNALKIRDTIWNSARDDLIFWANAAGKDLEPKLQRKHYFRHQVLEYARAKNILGGEKGLKKPVARGYLKPRKGGYDINFDYIEPEFESLSRVIYDTQIWKALVKIRTRYNIAKQVKANAKQWGFKNWKEAIPDGYIDWSPDQGHPFYIADSIPARIAKQILGDAIDDIAKVKDSLRKIPAVGKQQEWVIPKELAQTLDQLKQQPPNWLARGSKKVLRAWKVWTLISPRRFFKYNIRNLTGDADAVFVGNPSTFKKIPKAIKELYDLYASGKPMSEELAAWFKRGGMESTLQAQELGDVKQLRLLSKQLEQIPEWKELPTKTWKAYWKTARLTTDFREAILRYASYLDYLEQMQKSSTGIPKNFGASISEEVMGLSNIRDRAFRLSNELLGAYDEISVFGQALRNHIYPFWSWKELNFKRYVRLFKNAARNNKLSSTIGRSLAVKIPVTGIRVGRFLTKAISLQVMMNLWNHLMFPDLEAQLPSEVAGRAHIVLGQDENGKVQYFSRIGALSDFLEWFGLDGAPHLVSSWISGKKTLKDIATEMGEAPINQLVQGLHPGKIGAELLMRRALFPDAFNPRVIRDRGEHIARSLGLENEYKSIFNKPSEKYKESLPLALLYESDPLETAYYEIYDLKNDYLKQVGKTGEGFWLTPRSDALYNMKLAHRYGDKKAEEKYINDYIRYHLLEYKLTGKSAEEVWESIEKGISRSLENMHPLSGLTQNEQISLVMNMDEEEKENLVKAIAFYTDTLLGTSQIEINLDNIQKILKDLK